MTKKKRNVEDNPSTHPRAYAVRSDVRAHLDAWSKDRVKGKFAAKMEAVFRNLKAGKLSHAEMGLKQIIRCAVAGATGDLKELGPNQKGGAPRVFLLLRHKNFYFLAADVEEGSSGARIIPTAKARSADICASNPPRSLDEVKRMLGSDYEVVVIAIPDETTGSNK